MKQSVSFILLIVMACAATAIGDDSQAVRVVTLLSNRTQKHQGNDERRACFSFKHGARPAGTGGQWELGFGFMAINDEDWFILSPSRESRSVIRDLGELQWTDAYQVPSLKLLPALPDGQQRQITVDASADTGKQWAATTTIFAKVITGHLYALHIKDQESDFYVLFRVERFERGTSCTFSWKPIPSPDPPQ